MIPTLGRRERRHWQVKKPDPKVPGQEAGESDSGYLSPLPSSLPMPDVDSGYGSNPGAVG